jgi:hypothetical protein
MSEHLDQEDLSRFIELTSLFRGLEEAARARIASAMVQRTYEAGTTIIRQGQSADTLFIITLGRVGVFRQDEQLGVEQEVAQRLLRRICPNCKAQAAPSELVRRNLERAGILDMAESELLAKGAGCSGCHKTGFQGRVGAYEVLRLNDPIRDAIGLGESEATLRRLSKETNALTSFQDYSASC